MEKRAFYWMSMAVFVCAISMMLASCKDDDKDDNKSPEQIEQEAQEAASKFWDVVGQLTTMDNYTADYQNKTFEPTIGQPSEGNPYVRVVATNDMASAAQRFASLVDLTVGDGFPVATASYTWKDDAIGTLTYTKTDNGSSWAEVEVSIKQLPHLQKIIYQAPEQMGTNASFDGSAYYRFGDVVKKTNEDGKPEYWICVRPAFGKEGKGDSHWVTLSPLPSKNMEHITKNGKDYYVPKGLGKNEEQMQNFAEMLFAMMAPEEWETNVKKYDAPTLFYTGLRMFHDFSHAEDMVKYHNRYFWQRVRRAWDELGLFKTIFGFTSDDEQFQKIFSDDYNTGRLHLLYSGYSWWSSVSSNLTIYEYKYANSLENEDVDKLNYHMATKREIKKDMTDLRFNVRDEYTLSAPYLMYTSFFDDSDPYYIIRHATGAELTAKGSKWDYKQPITGVENVYVYNYHYYPYGTDYGTKNGHFRDLTLKELEVTIDYNNRSNWIEMDYEGDSHYLTGDVCIDEEGSRWFCMINAGCDLTHAETSYLKAPYSYFISFDNVVDEDGTIAKEVAQASTVPKLMVPLMQFIYEYSVNPNSPLYKVLAEDILLNANLDVLDMAVIRDTVVTIQGSQKQEERSAICTNVAIPTADKLNWQVMRIVYDGAHDNTEERQWNAYFYTKYENTDVPIYLKDIAKQEMVNRYGPDRWVVLPWHNRRERHTWRTETDDLALNIYNYSWNDGVPVSGGKSMWYEPVLVFRIDKVYDRGGNYSTKSIWKHEFKKVIYSNIRKDDSWETVCQNWWKSNSHAIFVEDRMFMDGSVYKWNNYSTDMVK